MGKKERKENITKTGTKLSIIRFDRFSFMSSKKEKKCRTTTKSIYYSFSFFPNVNGRKYIIYYIIID